MNANDQLESYLSDAHSIEEQALTQMRAAPDIAGDPRLAEIFTRHLEETEGHERLTRERLEAHGGKPSKLKEAVMKAGGAGFVMFAGSQPDTPGKLVAHAYSYEHLELASYELLEIVARRAGDEETAEIARRIRDEEKAMAERLEASFDTAVDASLRELDPDDLQEQVTKYLADAHALEQQAKKLLEKASKEGGTPELERIYSEHLGETKGHAALVEQRLDELGSSPSKLKDAAMKLGALNWGAFFKAQPDTPGKLAAFAYAFEHLEIAGYEELKRTAARAGDTDTVNMCDRILGEEREAARKVAGAFEGAVEASLQAVAT
jgi:ferritin-like metal-binding protein YciE